jgi:DNA-binding transcriptional LysR family regulator
VYPTGPYDLFGMLADFRAAPPGVAIHMVEDTQDDVLAALRADELDCAFTALDPDALGNEFAATLLWEEEIVVALPPGHRCAARRRSRSSELAAEDLIAYRENSALRRRLERAMAERGSSRATRSSAPRWAPVRALASKGLGVAVHPALGRRAARAADRAAADRARAADVAGRARLARVAPTRRRPARRSSRSRSTTRSEPSLRSSARR